VGYDYPHTDVTGTRPRTPLTESRGGLVAVTDPVISRFAEACGATGPLDLRVDLADGGLLAEGSVPMPFALVGRDDACDVTLTDAEVNPRHAWLQVVSGRVLAVDLGSRAGLGWPGRATGSGWLDVGTPVQVGPFQVRLRSPVSGRPNHFPPGYSPLQSDPIAVRSRPGSVLEFRNGKRAKDRWAVNRLVTLVGRAPECKIRLNADDIAAYHCGLVLTPDGLWVVDLSGRGVVVNGERMRVSFLRHGTELWVGRFLIGLHCPAASPTPGPSRATTPTPPMPIPTRPALPAAETKPATPALAPTAETPPPREPPDDEVLLGVVPPRDPLAGLPSSHILADAFRLWAHAASGASNPILVSGSGAVPHPLPLPASLTAVRNAPAPPVPDTMPAEAAVVALLRQLGELHGQVLASVQQSLVLMVQLFACLRQDQLPAMEQELARIQELNGELALLQTEVARRAAAPVAPPVPASMAETPPPAAPAPAPAAPPPEGTALHEWVIERIGTLQRERQARWQSLVGMFSGKTA